MSFFLAATPAAALGSILAFTVATLGPVHVAGLGPSPARGAFLRDSLDIFCCTSLTKMLRKGGGSWNDCPAALAANAAKRIKTGSIMLL